MSLQNCKLIDLPKIADARGNLTFVEGGRHMPFHIKRVYYLYDVPGGAERGGHAHTQVLSLPIGPHLSIQHAAQVIFTVVEVLKEL